MVPPDPWEGPMNGFPILPWCHPIGFLSLVASAVLVGTAPASLTVRCAHG